jgi:hypothetical protein
MSVFTRSGSWSLLLGAVLLLGGCAAADDADQAPQRTTPRQETVVTTDDTGQRLPERVPAGELPPQTVTGEVPSELLGPIVADAAERRGVAAADIAVVTDQEMLWADGSLGCAEPGEVYTQAQVPGYWVVLEAGGVAFDYRLDRGGFFKLCTSPLPGPGDSAPTS